MARPRDISSVLLGLARIARLSSDASTEVASLLRPALASLSPEGSVTLLAALTVASSDRSSRLLKSASQLPDLTDSARPD